jgi:hypothetical protein
VAPLSKAPPALRRHLEDALQLFHSYNVKTVEELKAAKPKAEDGVVQVKHLAVYDSFRCLQLDCTFYTRYFSRMKEHRAAYKKKSLTRELDVTDL